MKKTLVVLASALSMSSVFAQASAPVAAASTPAATLTAASAASAPAKAATEPRRVHVEKRITYLHNQLKITPEQEKQWGEFADVMRANSTTMSALYQHLKGNALTSALDNMKEYAALTRANADGTQKLVEAFEPLYANLSPEQKKLADKTFRQSATMHHGKHSASKKAAPASQDEATPKP
ncbi:Spy/CpxP family protein refolding chaperone [Paraburkholderia bonniea]|uniref:Spy/CpxP family protein refolding chaperone n=1 Tax=Paraburkholderia bonniea TaxID=2152891 RepID=UPI001292B58D|nr:Spy/CpxP family protein refolding chaperone [Paraburkholderia bonniea]